MNTNETGLLLIGCGNMGSALAKGWRVCLLGPSQLTLIDPHAAKRSELASQLTVSDYKSIASLPDDFHASAICLATKPDGLSDALNDIKTRFSDSKPLILSIAAGKPLSFYESRLWDDAAVIRIMPNTPSLIGMGMSVCVANKHATPAQQSLVTTLMDAVGKTSWLKNETLMDAVTAISGSGPAYVFYFIECLIEAAIAAGFDDRQAKQLAIQTVCGAAQLAAQSTESPSQLRDNVTSKGGTTQAALSVLMSNSDTGFKQIISDAVAAAKKRSLEISAL